MLRVTQQSHRPGLLGEVHGAPEDRNELARHSVHATPVGQQQYVPALLQFGKSTVD